MAYTVTRVWKAGSSSIKADWNALISANMDVANQQQLVLTSTGVALPGTVAARFIAPYALTIDGVYLSAGSASTADPIVADILRTTATDGTPTTLFTSSSELPTLAADKTGTTTLAVPDVTSVSAGHILTARYLATGSTATADLSLIISMSGA